MFDSPSGTSYHLGGENIIPTDGSAPGGVFVGMTRSWKLDGATMTSSNQITVKVVSGQTMTLSNDMIFDLTTHTFKNTNGTASGKSAVIFF